MTLPVASIRSLKLLTLGIWYEHRDLLGLSAHFAEPGNQVGEKQFLAANYKPVKSLQCVARIGRIISLGAVCYERKRLASLDFAFNKVLVQVMDLAAEFPEVTGYLIGREGRFFMIEMY